MPLLYAAEDSDSIYEATLDKGLKNNEPYAYTLIKKAQATPKDAKTLLTEAMRHSPNLPAVYFELGRQSFSFTPIGIFESMDYMIEGFKAYKRNFWWLRGITGLLFISLLSSFVVTLVVVICIRFFIETPLLSHDVTEDKKKVLVVLLLIPLSLLGPLFFVVGALFLLGLYFRKIDKTVIYLSALLLLLSPFFLRTANIFLSSSSPELRAIVAVNEGTDNKHAISVLRGKNDFVSFFSYGLALKREGRYEEAIAIYNNILTTSSDPMVYINLGNCYYGINDLVSAKDFYKKSIEAKPLVSAYYNLSQVSRETLDFAKGEEYFLEARKLSKGSLSRTYISNKNPNRFVVDETLPMSAIWKYADSKYRQLVRITPLNPAMTVVVSVIFVVIFYMIGSRMKFTAYRCTRCGAILCSKCSKELLWGQMCQQCYKSIVKLDELDSRERVTRVLEVQELQSKRRKIIKILSFGFPGIAHICAGRISEGSLFLWLFLFLLTVIMLNPLFSTGLFSYSHMWLTVLSSLLIVVLYFISNITIRRTLNRGWL